MLLKNSISKAKRLFNTTLQSFKDLISGGYQRLPKTPPLNPFSCSTDSKNLQSFRELDNFYEDFTYRWGIDQENKKSKKKKKIISMIMPRKSKETIKERRSANDQDVYSGSFLKYVNGSPLERRGGQEREEEKRKKMIEVVNSGGESSSRSLRAEASGTVAQRLKELELMDASNVDHLQDIEEVLHYYSRITCPFYIDIFNKFFTEMYAEFLPQCTTCCHHQRQISGW